MQFHNILNTKSIKLIWISSHVGIRGNETVDSLAKESLKSQPINLKLPSSDFKPSINKFIFNTWKTIWNNAVFNKLHAINPELELSPALSLINRRDQIVILRCRIGHTRLTHSYLLTRDDPPICIPCNENYSVKHFLLECHDLAQVRNKYFQVNSLNELFKTIPSCIIINYLKEVNLYSKI